jgi:hypothetical protein
MNEAAMSETITMDRKTLQIAFDCAVNSMDLGSGLFDDEEVEVLRAVAVLLGVDPMVATPQNFVCKYEKKHKPYTDGRFGVANRCSRCQQTIS